MGPAQRFEQVVAWQKSHALALRIYAATRDFPREELFGLTSHQGLREQLDKPRASWPATSRG